MHAYTQKGYVLNVSFDTEMYSLYTDNSVPCNMHPAVKDETTHIAI